MDAMDAMHMSGAEILGLILEVASWKSYTMTCAPKTIQDINITNNTNTFEHIQWLAPPPRNKALAYENHWFPFIRLGLAMKPGYFWGAGGGQHQPWTSRIIKWSPNSLMYSREVNKNMECQKIWRVLGGSSQDGRKWLITMVIVVVP